MRSSLEELEEAARHASPRWRVRRQEYTGLFVFSVLSCIGGACASLFGLYLLVRTIEASAQLSSVTNAKTAVDTLLASGVLMSLIIFFIGILMLTLGSIGIVVRDVAQRIGA